MLTKLVGLVLTGVVSLGLGNGGEFFQNLTDEEQDALIEAKEAAVEVLTEDEKAFVATLEGKEMRDLTAEERTEVREINQKLGEATRENITDEDLKAKLDANHEKREAQRGQGKRNGTGQGRGNGECLR